MLNLVTLGLLVLFNQYLLLLLQNTEVRKLQASCLEAAVSEQMAKTESVWQEPQILLFSLSQRNPEMIIV